MGAAHRGHRVGHGLARRADVHLRVAGHGQQEVLGGDVLVAEAAGLLLGAAQEVAGGALEGGLLGGLPARGGQAVERLVRAPAYALGVGARATEHRRHDAAVLLEQRGQHVVRGDLRVAARGREPLGRGDCLLGLGRESVGCHRIRRLPARERPTGTSSAPGEAS
ncbi:MAG: hypothetical protein WKF31_00960 [Thermoleophilaceae bacterium]